jgi:uncharacterized protein YjiS (DUF1127 family)
MAWTAIHFVDPTIPGLSGRDLLRGTGHAIQATCVRAGRAVAASRRDFAIRKALAHLDRHQLRDLGLDRSAL